jgi:hypothetical protein
VIIKKGCKILLDTFQFAGIRRHDDEDDEMLIIIPTKNCTKFTTKEALTDDRCGGGGGERGCSQSSQTTEYIVGFITLTTTNYTHRRNNAVKIVFEWLARGIKLLTLDVPYSKISAK